MKLESIAVRNFRGIGPADGLSFPTNDVQLVPIDFTADMILVVGPNNAGKSSLLHAYCPSPLNLGQIDLSNFGVSGRIEDGSEAVFG